MRRLKRWLAVIGVACLFIATALYFAHPWLAITERSGGKVMVVEGWMDDEHIAEAARLFKQGGYEKIYTTGTTRPFAYYLVPGSELDVAGDTAASTSLEIGLAGLPACSVIVLSGPDTLLHVRVTDRITTHGIDRKLALDDIRIVAAPPYPQPGPPSVFIHSLRFNGRDAHELPLNIRIIAPDGSVRPGEPTYAQHAARVLEESGVAGSVITPVLAVGDPISRSWANAATLAFALHGRSIAALDVVTLGVHARRSRALYREALGDSVRVGIISIPDPDCPAKGWWKSKKGWYFMLKEIAGSQEARAVDVAR
ncbi:MAG: hypothetical protein ABI599_17970 [Flavobacteriales bacterium]